MNARARLLSAVLLASFIGACASSSPSPSTDAPQMEAGSPARLWQRGAATGDLARFSRDGTRVAADGALELDTTAKEGTDPYPAGGWLDGGTFYNGGAFRFGTATSEVQSVPGGFDSVVPSFDAQTPPGTWVKLTVAARIEGTWTKDYELGVWAFDAATVARHSVDGQGDADGNVFTDTLNLKRRADALRVTVVLFSERPDASPRIRGLAAAVTDTRMKPAADAAADRGAWGTVLDVPGYSQMIYPDGGEVWCSPTSTTMLLGYWSRKLGVAELEHPVPTAAAHTYDWVYKGTGNWAFNTAYAASMANGALHGLVARFDSFAPVERLIAAGIPVSISIAYEPGELTGGASRRTDGHLIVVKGFTAEGDVVVNDPAFDSNETTSATYRRAELWRAWQHSRGAAYVLWPAGTALPAPGLEPLP